MTAKEKIIEYAQKYGWAESDKTRRRTAVVCLQHGSDPDHRVWIDYQPLNLDQIQAVMIWRGSAAHERHVQLLGGVSAVKKHLRKNPA